MSFAKAEQLMELAVMVSARRSGVTVDEIRERFEVSHRTAQRMLRALERSFPETKSRYEDDGRKRWRLRSSRLDNLITLTAEEAAAFDLAVQTLDGQTTFAEVKSVSRLRDKIMALVPDDQARRLKPDVDALLEAQGVATRPGPRTTMRPEVAETIAGAIKAMRLIRMHYRSRHDRRAHARTVAPYGILLGTRRYLVARPIGDRDGGIRHFRAEGIEAAELLEETFERDPGFSLEAHARRAFGSYQDDAEYGEVVWRFRPEATPHAREFLFHPDQTLECQPDGSLIVRFQAAGHLEMCWYLYSWGNTVEVLAPEALRKMVEGYRRSDFPALP